ncbi:hypothetical protein V6N11_021167 [Hibiscus sabdariffa]|uniref:Secreted protein n=1 Tax=Hibiscus sabdariffa TaxID=183260 RepID=A0ABR2A4E6_9ROSI
MSACLRAAWLTGGCCASRESDWPPLGGVLQVRFRWPYRAVTPLGGAARYWPSLAWMLPALSCSTFPPPRCGAVSCSTVPPPRCGACCRVGLWCNLGFVLLCKFFSYLVHRR